MKSQGQIDSIDFALNVTGKKVRDIIHRRKKLKRPGIDKLRFDHLKILIGYENSEHPGQQEFANLLANICTLIMDGDAPREVYDLLRDNELVAIPKSNNDVRPIGMGSTLRKLCSLILLNSTMMRTDGETKNLNDELFGGRNYGMSRSGCESIVHTMRLCMELHADKDMFCMDADNAFNRASRIRGLCETFEKCPHFLPFLKSMYDEISNGWFFEKALTVRGFESREGFHQGDVFGSWLYCLSMKKFIDNLCEKVEGSGWVKFFIDDGNICCDSEKMMEALDLILSDGPKFGYVLKMNKGKYLIGRCATDEEAFLRRDALIAKGLSEDIIKLHPDNGGDAAEYGVKVLGSYVGTDEFMAVNLESKLVELKVEADALIRNISNYQIRNLTLRFSFSTKIIYLLRTIPPDVIEPFVVGFENLEKKILCSLLDIEPNDLTDFSWRLSKISIKQGGLGLGDKLKMRFSAFHTSSLTFLEEAKRLFGGEAVARTRWKEQSDELFAKLEVWDPGTQYTGDAAALDKLHSIEKLQSFLSHFYEKFNYTELLDSVATDKRKTAWLVSNHDSISKKFDNPNGLWLEVNPKSRMHRISNKNFAAALNLRLFLRRRNYHLNAKCGCNKIVDNEGCHFITGCNNTKRITLHNMVRDQVDVMLRCNGLQTVKEDREAFRIPEGGKTKIPDITVFHVSSESTVVLDVRLTSPVPLTGNATFDGNPLTPGRAAQKALREKTREYKGINEIDQGEIRLVPIVAEISGRFHEDSLEFFYSVFAATQKARGIPLHTIWRYWMSALMVTLQNGIGFAIHHYSDKVNRDVAPIHRQHLAVSNIMGLGLS
jgi:hypothetical protein